MNFFNERGYLRFGHSDYDGKAIAGRIESHHHFRPLSYELDRLGEGKDAAVYRGRERSDGEACYGFGPDALFRKRPSRRDAGRQ
jgi:hypothetical protein